MALDGKQWSHVAAGLRGSDVLMGGKPIRRSRKESWAVDSGAMELWRRGNLGNCEVLQLESSVKASK